MNQVLFLKLHRNRVFVLVRRVEWRLGCDLVKASEKQHDRFNDFEKGVYTCEDYFMHIVLKYGHIREGKLFHNGVSS